MQVAVTRRIDDDALAILASIGQLRYWDNDLPPDRDELLKLLDGVDGALMLLTDRVDAGLLDRCPSLRVVSNLAVGFDNIDVAACTARRVAACTTPNVLTQTTAEFTIALLMAVARQVVPAARAARDGDWKTWYPFRFLGRDLAGATLGIVGLGRIGASVAQMATGLGMRVVYSSGRTDERYQRLDIDELLETADIVSLHVPATPTTHHLIDAHALALMKSDAILINTSRGTVIDADALVAALEEGRLFGVGLDVTDPEPLPSDHPLYSFDRVTIVPHIASATMTTRMRMSSLAAQNVVAVLTGVEPPHCLNPEVLRNV
ncbi:MAG TPA: D-glycerate dehydrogenase [Thermomicrobiales bacterium]|jgi:glyoxylate reductase|nr:D-glycerate dehydrogenase [Chloroflexota bacterium]HBY44724.1 D-glycerate dehydrogenase [Chloroflexota bacterium]HQX64143.1 D-glycerate dehydrogenase [Thermomicrobiales bacterium]